MSLSVALDRETLTDALTDDSSGVLSSLINVCDHVVFNDYILREYGNISALLPTLERLREMQPRPKLIVSKSGPKSEVKQQHHRYLFQSAIMAKADIIIMSVALRGKWETLDDTLRQQYGMRIITPEQYVIERNTGN